MTESREPTLSIEVVLALPGNQEIVELELQAPATVDQAIRQSGFYERFPGQALHDATVGIWGNPVDRSTRLSDGDRVEFYRPLAVDPRDARRARADI